ncbi:MAG: bifunctional phosphoribosylaminoimidazolecarboxamide formyltransferase/IMP cyclohydrolase [Crocinitomicaceae bacterium]|nr:bifunctional phosphoribosylaminoimidazolecarboxamide formyltransferase/IMP cyclohydrolase [Crocinitomicaceae bacterium]MDP4722841.1 bifunctional phosphoribosylaminoimidazolecarboxamide formyltransferase/IMP cyclohydrolase [Crocinitomicaceae bacterium]MDP4739869.1 bifunctional phosphoribosylaminoimidazolecarboxamide formyltransferase/IMP cyclohydrolase [Crocinitomicaceae bacterium]MDP4798761.1 bifunctional phosphoribosylaminoimidazolecarboxamide formyltransferase/IMP cyclohydrolase [Crocinitom
MTVQKPIQRALISVFYKDGLAPIVEKLHAHNVEILSTGGTLAFINEMGIPVTAVEDVTQFPEILGGRVKTLHPAIFGGILNRRDFAPDQAHMAEHELSSIDLVIVDLYPFEQTVASGASNEDIIEKIDIGGISLIRAAAKNYNDVVIIPSVKQYASLLDLLNAQGAQTTLAQRHAFAAEAFHVSSHYDTMIHQYFMDQNSSYLKISEEKQSPLRYGENPHQKGIFFGDLEALFTKIHGKELSYNNLLDVDAAVRLMQEFKNDGPTFAILKHNNACGLASRSTLKEAYEAALAADPVSAFGGILIANKEIDLATATLVNDLFCEVLIAPAYAAEAISLLQSKKNRIILIQNEVELPQTLVRSALNGYLVQDADMASEGPEHLVVKTVLAPSEQEIQDLLFANKLVKHTKSNTIILAKDGQLLASGTGQTSRVDALKQAIHKAKSFGFDLNGAAMASDAFFPFPDCVEIAHLEGINAVIQPGGSVKDELSIAYCDENQMKMVFTGVRHFKH